MLPRILIIDDDFSFADDLKENLEGSGPPGIEYSVYLDPRDVQADVARGRLEGRLICILDHDFRGDTTGIDLAKWLILHHPLGRGLRFVYLTGRLSDQEFYRHRNKTYGPIDHFFMKSVPPRELQQAIADLVHQLGAEGSGPAQPE